jgi:hypothetical protein
MLRRFELRACTYKVARSALPPIADIGSDLAHICFVPEPDMAYFVSVAAFELVGGGGENEKVSHVLKPDGRLCASNSP